MEQKNANARRRPGMPALLAVLALAALVLGTAGVWAYLHMRTSPADNAFQAASNVNPAISEVTVPDGGSPITEKKDVTVNVGNTSVTIGDTPDAGYSVYVRAAVIVTWQDAAGNVYFQNPTAGGTSPDYQIIYNGGSGADQWTYNVSDGYWYYNSAVTSGQSTAKMIKSCTALKAAPKSGYTLNVTIAAQTIQSAGTTDGDTPVSAKEDAWNYIPPP